MSIFFYLVQTNFIDFTIVLFLYLFLVTNHTMSKDINRIFLICAIVITVLIFADSTDYYLAQGSVLHNLRYFTSATGYTCRPIPILLLAAILKRGETGKRHLWYLYLPLAINAVVAYTSIFTKWMFYYDEENQFHRGPLGVLPFLISAIYLLCLLVWSLERYYLGYKREGTIMVFIVFMSVVATCMETFLHFNFILNGVGAVGTVFYYLFLHTQTYKRDALTWTFNRHAFYTDCETYRRQPMMVVSVDINDLKVINDTEGHAKGDQAIVTVANTLRSCFANKGTIYRVGGDEFVVLCPKASEAMVRSILHDAEQSLFATPYRIACGVAAYSPDMSLDKVLSKSDAEMYRDKKSKKQKKD